MLDDIPYSLKNLMIESGFQSQIYVYKVLRFCQLNFLNSQKQNVPVHQITPLFDQLGMRGAPLQPLRG